MLGFVLFVTPYADLIRKRQNDQGFTMFSVKDLQNGASRGDYNHYLDDFLHIPEAYLDVAGLALAQQTLLSGVYVTDEVAEIVIANKFGGTAAWPAVDPNSSDERAKRIVEALVTRSGRDCATDKSVFDAYPFAVVACMLSVHPELQINFINRLVTRELRKSQATLGEYAFALESGNGYFIRRLLPGLDLERVGIEGKSRWNLRLLGAKGQPWYIELPTAAIVRSNVVAYSAAEPMLRELRDDLLSRVVFMTASSKIEPKDTTQFLLRQAGLNDIGLARITFYIPLPEEPGAKSTQSTTMEKKQ